FAGQLAVRKQKCADIRARRQFEPAAFEEPEILIETGESVFRLLRVGSLDRLFDFSTAPAEADLEVTRRRMLFEPSHEVVLPGIVRRGPFPGPATRFQRDPNCAPQMPPKRGVKKEGAATNLPQPLIAQGAGDRDRTCTPFTGTRPST